MRAAVFSLLCAFATSGCVVGFTNAHRGVNLAYSRVYIPAANDASSLGGHSGRISSALRRKLALDTRFQLSDLRDARWGVDIRVLNREQTFLEPEECTVVDGRRTGSVAGGFSCALWSGFEAELVPDASSAREAVQLTVFVRALDLNTGRIIFSDTLNLSETFDIISADGDRRLQIAQTRELHTLRYLENRDDAVDRLAVNLANRLYNTIQRLDLERGS